MFSPRVCIAVGALMAGLAVALGAFGAHWLRVQVPLWYHDDTLAQARMLDTWEVAVRYQIYSAIGIILLGLWARQNPPRSVAVCMILFLVGSVVFSGLLYALVLSGIKALGMIVPIGGFAMIAGWVVLAWQALRERE